jgi:hypothetical protein
MDKRLEVGMNVKALFDRFQAHRRISQSIWKKLRSALRAEQTTLAQARAGLASPKILRLLHSKNCCEGRVAKARERVLHALCSDSVTASLLKRKDEEIESLRSQLRMYLGNPGTDEVVKLRREVFLLTQNFTRLNAERKHCAMQHPDKVGDVYLFSGDLPAHLRNVDDLQASLKESERLQRVHALRLQIADNMYQEKHRECMVLLKETIALKKQLPLGTKPGLTREPQPVAAPLPSTGGFCPSPQHQAALGMLMSYEDLDDDRKSIEIEKHRSSVRVNEGYEVENLALKYIDRISALRSISGVLSQSAVRTARAAPKTKSRGQPRSKRRG